MRAGTIYFHSPCFDGIASAVIAWDFLDNTAAWKDPTFSPVNYAKRQEWLAVPLAPPAAVLDFLFHPLADFWADHHLTTFVDPAVEVIFKASRDEHLIYDPMADSCAGLLWERLYSSFGHRDQQYAELVVWANKIDAARYSSVEEVIFATSPAIRLAMSLAEEDSGEYCIRLIKALKERPLHEVAGLSESKQRYERARTLLDLGLERFKQSSRLEADGIVVFDVDASDVVVSRYAPFHFYPMARYSLGIMRWHDGAKVTAMRNPWIEFDSVPLGPIAADLGGGGHRRIGSILLGGDDAGRSLSVHKSFLSQLRVQERQRAKS